MVGQAVPDAGRNRSPTCQAQPDLVRLQVYRIDEVKVLVRRFEFDPVADRNCVAARRGGEHREANGRSVTQVNSIRPVVVASLLGNGEAGMPLESRQSDESGPGPRTRG